MLRELGNEIIELFKEGEAKDTQIAELRRENEVLRVSVEPLNAQIAELQSELEVKIKEVEDKNRLLAKQNEEVARLQEQADLKLDEVKAIIEELKGLIVNA